MNKSNNFVREIPDGYEQVFYLNAKNKKAGLILNLVALIGFALIFVPARLLLGALVEMPENSLLQISIGVLVGCVASLVYMVLHELTHGAAYKITTGEKLTYGISWSCAFCGVPHIYVYRKYLIIACLAPFVIFSVVFMSAIAIWFIAMINYSALAGVGIIVYTALVTLFALHFGGCAGDLFIAGLLLFKYRNKDTLARDTGPEQTIYVKKEVTEQNENA